MRSQIYMSVCLQSSYLLAPARLLESFRLPNDLVATVQDSVDAIDTG